ncbi:MAG TPA: ATP-binding protein [Ktedonobacterales bacterium]|nr:ATP-binding protein [Ktedonobacterales bacterium]
MLDRLAVSNPWWSDSTAISRDRHLRALETSPFRRPLPIVETLRTDAPLVYTLRGPRQVGKTTAAKLLVRHLLEAGIAPRRVMYYALDLEDDPGALEAVVRVGMQTARATPPPAQGLPTFYFIFDEISSVPGWQQAIKWLRDNTPAAEAFFLLTGSVASDIRAGAERLPGRRGGEAHLDRILLPLSFGEFVTACAPDLAPPRVLTPADLVRPAGAAADALLGNAFLTGQLDDWLQRYLQVGGYPAAVRDHLTLPDGAVSESTSRQLWDMVAGDVSRFRGDPLKALRLIERVSIDLGSTVSYNRLATHLGYAVDTVEDYVRRMGEAFQLLTLHFFDLSKGAAAPKKNIKLYPVDPLLMQLPRAMLRSTRLPEVSVLVESVLAMALFRAAEVDLMEAFNVPRTLFYWRSERSSAEREVDFLLEPTDGRLAFESKYEQNVQGFDAATLRRVFGGGTLFTRHELHLPGGAGDDTVARIPAALALWLLPPGQAIVGKGPLTG